MIVTEQTKENIYIIGHGFIFDEIKADPLAYSIKSKAIFINTEKTESIIDRNIQSVFQEIPSGSLVFLALDFQALNYLRLENLYLPAKISGHKLISLIHKSTYISPDIEIGENVYIGAQCFIGSNSNLGTNVFIDHQSRLSNSVQIGMHTFVGSGTSIDRGTKIGRHCVIGNNIHIGKELEIGNHCTIDRPGIIWNENLQDGSFLESFFQTPAYISGLNYSFKKI